MSWLDGLTSKRCPRCTEIKNVEAFAIDNGRKDGRQAYCRTCQADLFAMSREARLQYRRDYYRRNRETMRASNRAWRAANPERARANSRTSADAWAAANPDAVRVKLQRYRARKVAAYMEDVHPLVLLERDDGICGICGHDVDPMAYDIDHIVPLSRGGEHSYANTQVAHPLCNKRKCANPQPEVLV